MDTARYYVALITVVAFPPPLLAWFLIHPLAGSLNRIGHRVSYLLIFTFDAAGWFSIWSVSDHLLRVDFGFSTPLLVLALVLLGVSVYVRVLWRRVLRPTTILGLPEIKGRRDPGDLVTTGIYSRIRHPRYLEVGLGLWSAAFFSNYPAVYVLGLAYIPLIYLIVRLEERELRNRFGPVYEDYCSRVPRFIPRMKHRGGGVMPNPLTREQVSEIVLDVIRRIEDNPNIREATSFWDDLRVDDYAKRTYYGPIRERMEDAGSNVAGLIPADLEKPKTVGEMIDLVFEKQGH